MKRTLRIVATLVVTGLCTAYLVWKIDISKTADTVANARIGYLLLAFAILLGTIGPLARRWQMLLEAKGIRDRFRWLVRAYFVSYAAGQILPTAVGGDAVRIFETSRRHPGRGGHVAGSILLERAIGAAATLVLAAVGFALALGRYDVGVYLWVEGAFVVGTVIVGVLLFARRARPLLALGVPLLRRLWLERPVRAVYEGIHSYRENVGVLLTVFAITLFVQAFRVLTIWLAAKAVGVDLSPRPYFVMGPLLFLVMLVPFTINGLAVRESFFVSFLGHLHVSPEAAFATGFLFFILSTALAVPGAAILAWENLRPVGPVPGVRARR